MRDGPPAGPGGGGKCAVGHESVVRKSLSGWSPYGFEMSSRRSSAWFFQGLWCPPTSEAPWENQALRHQWYDPSLDQWLSEWTHTASCCRWVLFEMVYHSIGSATGHSTRPLLFLLYINDLPDCINSQVRLFADDCLVYRKISSFKDQLHCREIWMPWKFGQELGEWNLTQVNAPFFQSQDPLPCINFTPYVAQCFCM